MNLYGVQNSHSQVAVMYAAKNASEARTYARQDLGWEYWDMEQAVLLQEDTPGEEGRVSVHEGLSLLEVAHEEK